MRICVITGGTGGIGLHLCEGFQRAGYAVTALDVEQHKALPAGIGFIQTDLRQAEAVSEAFRRVTEQHGAVHVLVNNAALAHFHKPVTEMTADEFDNALSVNLRGAFLRAGLHQGQRGAGLRAHHQYRLHPLEPERSGMGGLRRFKRGPCLPHEHAGRLPARHTDHGQRRKPRLDTGRRL